MTSLSPRARKDRLLRVFERTGGAGSWTRPFESFPDAVRESVRGAAELGEGEEIILLSYRSENDWILLTSEKLIAKQASVETRLDWPEISDATVESNEARSALWDSAEGKLNLRRLRIIRADGRVLEVELEPGPSFIAFWNVLKTVAALKPARQ